MSIIEYIILGGILIFIVGGVPTLIEHLLKYEFKKMRKNQEEAGEGKK